MLEPSHLQAVAGDPLQSQRLNFSTPALQSRVSQVRGQISTSQKIKPLGALAAAIDAHLRATFDILQKAAIAKQEPGLPESTDKAQ